MQTYVIFTCALTLLLTSLHVSAQQNNETLVIDDALDNCTLVQLQMSTSRDKHKLRDITNDLATLHKKNLLLETRNKNLHEQLGAVTSLQRSMTEQLDLQAVKMKSMRLQLEADIRKEIMRENLDSVKFIEKLTTEKEILRLKEQECQSYKDAVLKELRSSLDTYLSDMKTEVNQLINNKSKQYDNMASDNVAKFILSQKQLSTEVKQLIHNMSRQSDNMAAENIAKVLTEQSQHSTDIKTEVKQLINDKTLQSDNMAADNIAKVLSGQSQMSADIQAVSKSVSDVKFCQTQNLQIMSQLKAQDMALASVAKKLTCEIARHNLNTTYLNNNTYYFSYEQPKMTWFEADNFCRSHNMQLVSVESREKWDLLKPEVKKMYEKFPGYPPWSCGSDAAEEGKWKWTATGSDVTFYGGRHSSANDANENCMYLYTDYWDDWSCTGKLTFICEVNSPC